MTTLAMPHRVSDDVETVDATVTTLCSYSMPSNCSVMAKLTVAARNVTNAAYGTAASLAVDIPGRDREYGPVLVTINDPGGGAGIDNAQTVIGVNNVNGIEVNDIIEAETELMKVSSIASPNLTVVRGVAGTAAAAHADGVGVHQAAAAFVYSSAGDPITAADAIKIEEEVLSVVSVDTANNILLTIRDPEAALAAQAAFSHAASAAINQVTGNTGAGYWRHHAARRHGGANAVAIGSEGAVVTDKEDTSGWAAVLEVSGNSIRGRVTGAASTRIRWVGELEVLLCKL